LELGAMRELYEIVNNMDATFRYAGADKILRYANAQDMRREDIRSRLGRSVEECHGVSLPEFRRLYQEWAEGSREVQVYINREGGDSGARFDIMVPVHDSSGFRGVVEILFDAKPQER